TCGCRASSVSSCCRSATRSSPSSSTSGSRRRCSRRGAPGPSRGRVRDGGSHRCCCTWSATGPCCVRSPSTRTSRSGVTPTPRGSRPRRSEGFWDERADPYADRARPSGAATRRPPRMVADPPGGARRPHRGGGALGATGVLRMSDPLLALVVDDSDDQVGLLRRYLQRSGCEVASASTGERALELLHDLRPDISIVDLVLPGISGAEVAAHLRATQPECLLAITSVHDASG